MMKRSLSKSMVLITVILIELLSGAEVDLFVPSFPELQNQFNLTPFWVEALLSVNFAGYCLSLLFVGGLGDRYGRKPIILYGLVIFIIGSSLCLWALTYNFLLVGRFLQGAGVAAPAILGFLIIADTYPLKQQQYLMAILNGVVNTAIAAAPVLGSYITMYFHWQGNFVGLLFLGIITLIMAVLFIPSYKLPVTKEPLSLRGYIPIFKSKPMMLFVTNTVFIGTVYWVFMGMTPILYMEDLGVSLAHFGYYQGALALVFGLGSILSGFIARKYDQKKLLYISGVICTFGVITLAWVTWVDCRNPLLITLAFMPYNIGVVMPITIFYPLCLNLMPEAKGRISAVLQGTRLILTGLALEIAGYFYVGSFRNIGIIITGLFLLAILTLFLILKNRALMKLIPES